SIYNDIYIQTAYLYVYVIYRLSYNLTTCFLHAFVLAQEYTMRVFPSLNTTVIAATLEPAAI
nr:hypothetical protein [Dehalococcoidia bacterium]